MKLLLISALLLVFSTLTADGAAVYDISGNIVKTRRVLTVAGSFLFFAPQNECRWCCPQNVAQKLSNLDNGLPVSISPSDSSEEFVHLLTDLKIEFTTPPPDGGSPVWKLGSAEPNGQRYVTLNGSPDNAVNVDNLFKIEKAGALGFV